MANVSMIYQCNNIVFDDHNFRITKQFINRLLLHMLTKVLLCNANIEGPNICVEINQMLALNKSYYIQ